MGGHDYEVGRLKWVGGWFQKYNSGLYLYPEEHKQTCQQALSFVVSNQQHEPRIV